MLCQDCPKRNICTELCEKVEVYVSQDEIDWGETPTIYVDPDNQVLRVFNPKSREPDKAYLTDIEKSVLRRLGSGMTRQEISKDLNITRHYIRNICLRLKHKASQL